MLDKQTNKFEKGNFYFEIIYIGTFVQQLQTAVIHPHPFKFRKLSYVESTVNKDHWETYAIYFVLMQLKLKTHFKLLQVTTF